MRHEAASGAIGEHRYVKHHAMRRQAGKALLPLLHGQPVQIADGNAAFEGLQVAANQGLQGSIEGRGPAHDEDVARFRLESQRNVECGCERALHQDSGDAGGKRLSLKPRGLDAGENDGHAGEQHLCVPQQEVERRLHHRDDEIRRRGCVLAAIKVGNRARRSQGARSARGPGIRRESRPRGRARIGRTRAGCDRSAPGRGSRPCSRHKEQARASVRRPSALTMLAPPHAPEACRHSTQ